MDDSLSKQIKQPYKFLDYFRPGEAEIFCGRNKETKELLSLIEEHWLVVVCGKSGVGKTSLINAGLMPVLTTKEYLPVYLRILQDPFTAIKKSLQQVLKSEFNEKKSLDQILSEVASSTNKLVVFILDQFEEFFIRLSPEIRAIFISQLAEFYNRAGLGVKFVICLRSDFLAEMACFTQQIPTILHHLYHLQPFGLAQAKQAIIGPAEFFNCRYEPKVVEELLKELAADGIWPAQLQIVCSKLFEVCRKDGIISLKKYQQIGGAANMLKGYLDEMLKNSLSKQKALAQEILKKLLSSANTTLVLTPTEIANQVKEKRTKIESILCELENLRIVQKYEEEGYELCHEYLAEEIMAWIRPEEKKAKIAETLLQQEVANWHKFNQIIPLDRLWAIDRQREYLNLDDTARGLLLWTCLNYDYEAEYWLNQNQDNPVAIELLANVLNDKDKKICLTAALTLARMKINDEVGKRVLDVLSKFGNPNTINKLMPLQHHPESYVRKFAKQAINTIQAKFFKDMVHVKEGEFIMGSDKAEVMLISQRFNQQFRYLFLSEVPKRRVSLPGFYIDACCVTRAQFKEFNSSYQYPEGEDELPAINITWHEANEYAKWIGKELPSEEQWEKAARGTDGRIYPWGNTPEHSRCNVVESKIGKPIPVRECEDGKSPFGCYNVTGNVWEWTSSLWQTDARGDTSKGERVIKGGSVNSSTSMARCAARYNFKPEGKDVDLGFRCQSPTSPQPVK